MKSCNFILLVLIICSFKEQIKAGENIDLSRIKTEAQAHIVSYKESNKLETKKGVLYVFYVDGYRGANLQVREFIQVDIGSTPINVLNYNQYRKTSLKVIPKEEGGLYVDVQIEDNDLDKSRGAVHLNAGWSGALSPSSGFQCKTSQRSDDLVNKNFAIFFEYNN